jgi:hypothetical protein
MLSVHRVPSKLVKILMKVVMDTGFCEQIYLIYCKKIKFILWIIMILMIKIQI